MGLDPSHLHEILKAQRPLAYSSSPVPESQAYDAVENKLQTNRFNQVIAMSFFTSIFIQVRIFTHFIPVKSHMPVLQHAPYFDWNSPASPAKFGTLQSYHACWDFSMHNTASSSYLSEFITDSFLNWVGCNYFNAPHSFNSRLIGFLRCFASLKHKINK